jgi:hypothetical protein
VLRPGGTLALLWNETSDAAPSPLPEAYLRRFAELQADLVRAEVDRQEVLANGPFGELETASVEHEQVSRRDDVLAFAASMSWIASREDREQVLAELAQLLPPGEYRFAMRAQVEWTTRS